MAGAPRHNKNAQGKRVERERISLSLGISKKNGFLDLWSHYLALQGIEPTDEEIRRIANDVTYQLWADWLKREIEISQEASVV